MNSPLWARRPGYPLGTSILHSRFMNYEWGGPNTQLHVRHGIQAWQPAYPGPLGTHGQVVPTQGADIPAHQACVLALGCFFQEEGASFLTDIKAPCVCRGEGVGLAMAISKSLHLDASVWVM